jgi:hypothetical protein
MKERPGGSGAAGPVLVATPDRVVVKLNRPVAPEDRPQLLAVLCGALALALGLLLWLAPYPIHPAAAGLVWLALSGIAWYVLTVEATLIATPAEGAWVEHRGPLGPRRSRSVVCPPGAARAVAVREKVDLESDLRPWSACEVVAETSQGPVVLCTLGAREQADQVAASLAAVLGCRAQGV